jgi:ABC-type glycerol-3-phosphate transport system permease component
VRAFQSIRGSLVTSIVVVLLGLLTLLPFYFMVITSLKDMDTYLEEKLLPPSRPTFDNYIAVFAQLKLARYFRNSVVVLVSTLVPYMLICTAAGFAFAKLRFPLRIPLLLLVTAIMIFPQMVLGVQIYNLQARIGLLNTHVGLVCAYLGYFAPYAAYLMTTYFRNIPQTFLEAARIDGAGLWSIYARIMLPVARPMLVTVIIVGSQAVWNELPFCLLLLRSSEKRTLMAAIALLQGEYGVPAMEMCAALTVVALPIILLYVLAQRQIQRGILAGGIKE